MKAIDCIKDFFGALFLLIEAAGIVLLIGFAGSVEQNSLAVKDAAIYSAICIGVMIVVGIALYFMGRDDDRDLYI